jgi:DNA repair ATPase RecN
MFNELTLKNFRKHVDRTFTFDNGMIALRGANEDGKTTMLEAISYALGGARLLREPLSEVVTWGQKEASLKVSLAFTINGVQYIVTRSKSGAEIRTHEKIEATGQDEVSKYVETLLGCSVKTAQQLMLANQQKLRGTLEEDGAAVKLIEQLADFQLIDLIIALVQKHLPCGTTVAVEGRIKLLEEQVAVPVEDDTGPFKEQVAALQQTLGTLGEVYTGRKVVYDGLQQPARLAQERLSAASQAQTSVRVAAERLEGAKATFAAIHPQPGPDEATIAELRRQVEDATRHRRAVAAKQALLDVPEPAWEGLYAELQAAHNAARIRHTDLAAQIAEHAGNIKALKAQKITATACGLCGKDLSAVPEVVSKNATLDSHIATLEVAMATAAEELKDAEEEAKQYQAVINDGFQADHIFQQHAEFITLDRNFTPAKWEWIGPDTERVVTSPVEALNTAVAAAAKYQQELGRQQQAKQAVEQAEKNLNDATASAALALAAADGAQDVLDKAAAATQDLYEAEQQYRTADQAVKNAQRDLDTAVKMYEMRLNERKKTEGMLAAARKELSDMAFNNELVNALRKARPSIVEELWNIVGAGVSNVFSSIRGLPSTFARDNDSFTVDGRGIKGLSGSTLDALGLAIRITLTKTFLPNTRFLVVDEPAAAADENRETNMLGVIAASEFDQVLLVTHSDLADTFASQVIRL